MAPIPGAGSIMRDSALKRNMLVMRAAQLQCRHRGHARQRFETHTIWVAVRKERSWQPPPVLAKQRVIAANDLVVYRMLDGWDQFPREGMGHLAEEHSAAILFVMTTIHAGVLRDQIYTIHKFVAQDLLTNTAYSLIRFANQVEAQCSRSDCAIPELPEEKLAEIRSIAHEIAEIRADEVLMLRLFEDEAWSFDEDDNRLTHKASRCAEILQAAFTTLLQCTPDLQAAQRDELQELFYLTSRIFEGVGIRDKLGVVRSNDYYGDINLLARANQLVQQLPLGEWTSIWKHDRYFAPIVTKHVENLFWFECYREIVIKYPDQTAMKEVLKDTVCASWGMVAHMIRNYSLGMVSVRPYQHGAEIYKDMPEDKTAIEYAATLEEICDEINTYRPELMVLNKKTFDFYRQYYRISSYPILIGDDDELRFIETDVNDMARCVLAWVSAIWAMHHYFKIPQAQRIDQLPQSVQRRARNPNHLYLFTSSFCRPMELHSAEHHSVWEDTEYDMAEHNASDWWQNWCSYKDH